MGSKLKIVSWISIGALAGALITTQLQAVARGSLAPLPLDEMQQFAAVFGMIKTDYVEATDEKKLITDAIAGMVSNLDPHSSYLDKKSLKEFSESTSGKFVGVGIEISTEEGYVKVVTPIEGTPAFRAGIKANDLITKVDDWNTKGNSMNDAVKRMRGEPKTKVVLTILRRSENNKIFPVTIIRDEIKTQSVKSKLVDADYAWIRVSQFQEQTVDDFVRQASALYKQNPKIKGLVLDLRNDPGGLLDGAVAISAAFLPPDVPVVSTNGQLKESKFVYKASPDFYRSSAASDPLKNLPAAMKKVPVVVLVNEGSASASEIVAGALQDYKRATIMGSQTFGKGSVQNIRPLGETSALKLTIARYYTPNGRSIQSIGVLPDVLLDDTEGGSPFAVLRSKEADYEKHIKNPQGEESAEVRAEKTKALESAKEEARKRLEEEAKKEPKDRLIPEFGSERDFQLRQALNQLQGKPVVTSKLQVERKAEKKDN
jgi:carboxyl-terminal processing protease